MKTLPAWTQHLACTPDVCFGRVRVAGTGTAASTISDMVLAEATKLRPLDAIVATAFDFNIHENAVTACVLWATKGGATRNRWAKRLGGGTP